MQPNDEEIMWCAWFARAWAHREPMPEMCLRGLPERHTAGVAGYGKITTMTLVQIWGWPSLGFRDWLGRYRPDLVEVFEALEVAHTLGKKL